MSLIWRERKKRHVFQLLLEIKETKSTIKDNCQVISSIFPLFSPKRSTNFMRLPMKLIIIGFLGNIYLKVMTKIPSTNDRK